MEDITFEPSEIYIKDKKIIDKILNDLYEYLYNLIKNDIKKNIDINNNE